MNSNPGQFRWKWRHVAQARLAGWGSESEELAKCTSGTAAFKELGSVAFHQMRTGLTVTTPGSPEGPITSAIGCSTGTLLSCHCNWGVAERCS